MIAANPPIGRVGVALAEISKTTTSPSPGFWKFALGGRKSLTCTARAEEGWLTLRTLLAGDRRLNATSADRTWHLLGLGAGLPGGAKYALDGRSRMCVRAEVPIDPDEGADIERVAEAAEGFRAAAKRYGDRKRNRAHSGNGPAPVPAEGEDALCDIERLCDEADWPYVTRSNGRIMAELDVPGRFHQAIIAKRNDVLHIATHLHVGASAPPVCRRAVGLLLLTLNGAVRMARAVAADDGELEPRIEVVQAWCPTAAQLVHALNALSVACRICGSEVEGLLDEIVAAEFLKARGWSS